MKAKHKYEWIKSLNLARVPMGGKEQILYIVNNLETGEEEVLNSDELLQAINDGTIKYKSQLISDDGYYIPVGMDDFLKSDEEYKILKSKIELLGGEMFKFRVEHYDVNIIDSAIIYSIAYQETVDFSELDKWSKIFKVHIIGKEAYKRDNMIKHLIIPPNIKVIDTQAFYETTVEDIYFSEGLYVIRDSAFCKCYDLKTLSFPKSLRVIGARAFVDCYSLAHIEFNEGLQEIHGNAFKNCDDLESVIIPDSVLFLGEAVFNGCFCLRHVRLSKNIKKIPSYLFLNCHLLETIEIPYGTEVIDAHAFDGCDWLKEVKIPSSVNLIVHPDELFDTCKSLMHLVTPEKYYMAFKRALPKTVVIDIAVSSTPV